MTTRKPTADEEAHYYAGILHQVVRDAGFSVSEVERQLGVGPKALHRVFGGQNDFKFRHMVAVLRIIGISQEEFFSTAMANRSRGRKRPGSEFLAAFHSTGHAGQFVPMAGDEEAELSEEAFNRKVDEVLSGLEQRRAARRATVPADQRLPPGDLPGEGESEAPD